ncbi:phage tail protein [Opitutaceae bacterium TAV4]|nr:phage tail protein [Opitutaceae bacterium TAV4]RRK00812.1 phage tail protein [Opitutaceae bacterium TAV3]
MSAPILALGTFTFSTSTAAFDTLQRSTAWEWAEQKRVGAYPLMQYTGAEVETITLPGTVFPLHAGAGLGQLDKLRALAAKGEPQSLADGRGRSLGRWVIRSITEDQSNHLPGGAPRKQAFSITIARYHDD